MSRNVPTSILFLSEVLSDPSPKKFLAKVLPAGIVGGPEKCSNQELERANFYSTAMRRGEGSAGIAINARKGYEKKMQLRSGEWKMKDKNEITNRKGGGWREEGAVVGYFETDLRSVGYFLVGQTQG